MSMVYKDLLVLPHFDIRKQHAIEVHKQRKKERKKAEKVGSTRENLRLILIPYFSRKNMG